jgi:Tol biopolymer transport system component
LQDTPGKVLLRSEEFNYNVPFGWSPDGKDVFALLSRKDDTSLIAAIPASGGQPRQIASLEWRWPETASLSPDGRFIVYDAPVDRESPRNGDIFLLAADGSVQRALVADPSHDSNPAWTPDGGAVVFTSDRNGSPGLWMVRVAEGNAQGEAELLQRLGGDIEPIGFSRDGSFYYRTVRTGVSDVFTADVDLERGAVLREATRALEGSRGPTKEPAYSPDGTRLAYVSQRRSGGLLSIVVRSLESGYEQEIPTAFTWLRNGSLQWFPDGRSLLVSASNGVAREHAHRIDLQTRKVHTMVRLSFAATPFLSPDGRILYIVGSPPDVLPGDGNARIVAYDVETRRETQVAANGFTSRIAISPDGRYIATTSADRETPSLTGPSGASATTTPVLRLIPTDGSSPRTVRSFPGIQRLTVIQWSADGRKVLLQTGNGALWWAPADGEEPQPIGTGTFPPIHTLRPDLKQIAFTQSFAGQTPEVWVHPNLLSVAASRR